MMNFSTCSWSWARRTVTDSSERSWNWSSQPEHRTQPSGCCRGNKCVWRCSRGIQPHPSSAASKAMAEGFGNKYKVWAGSSSLSWGWGQSRDTGHSPAHPPPTLCPATPELYWGTNSQPVERKDDFVPNSLNKRSGGFSAPDPSLPLRIAAHITWRRMWMLLVLIQERGEQSNTSSHWGLLLSSLTRDSTRTPGMSPWAPHPSPGTRLHITPDTSGNENWPRGSFGP